MALFEGPLLNARRLEEAMRGTKFIRRLMSFYHPFNNRFADIRQTKVSQPRYCRVSDEGRTDSAPAAHYEMDSTGLHDAHDAFEQSGWYKVLVRRQAAASDRGLLGSAGDSECTYFYRRSTDLR
jgi:hypothetical protein